MEIAFTLDQVAEMIKKHISEQNMLSASKFPHGSTCQVMVTLEKLEDHTTIFLVNVNLIDELD
jgi:hypothetical protein